VIGRSPEEAIREVTREQLEQGMSPISIFSLNPAVSSFPSYYRPIIDRLRKIVSLRLWDRLKYAKFREDTVRIVLIDSGYFLTRELERAIKGLGHRVVKLSSPQSEREKGAFLTRVIECILNFRPDFFLTINHLGFDEAGTLTSFFRAIEMPVASWYVDSPNLIIKAHKGNVSPYTSIFLWDKGYIQDMRSMGFETVSYLPLATDPQIFRPLDPSHSKLRSFRCQVGFVGSSMLRPVEKWYTKIRPEWHRWVDELAGRLASRKGAFHLLLEDLPEQDKNFLRALSPKERMDLEAAIIWKATLLYRLGCIQHLRGFEVRIHGDPGWRTLLAGRGFKLYPPLNYFQELPYFYNACQINFNATNLQMTTAVNQRVFDVPACGSFILTDYQEVLEELFELNREIVCYREQAEIPELIRYYLSHSQTRDRIAHGGRKRVLGEHTYQHRLARIIKEMRSLYG